MFEIEEVEKIKEKPDKIAHQYSLEGKHWALIELFKGCLAGEHFHKGISKARDPEIQVLVKGKLKYFFRDTRTDETTRMTVEAPKIIKTKPFIYHEVLALEDSILIEPFDKDSPKDRFEL